MAFRIGIGYDVHALSAGYKLFIGGVEVSHTKGAVGHSDGDVLIHAICDAMLGALAMMDIGYHFPDTDPSLKGVDSKILLQKVYEIVESKGYAIVNIDSTVAIQSPRLKDLIPLMQETLEGVLRLQHGTVSVKATTTEKLGFVGKEEGISAHAVVLLSKKQV